MYEGRYDLAKISTSIALERVKKKQESISLLKKRISALSVREEKSNHRTINLQKKIRMQQSIKEDARWLNSLLERQQRFQKSKLQVLKNRNLNTRIENHYKSKQLRQNIKQNKKQYFSLCKYRSHLNQKLTLQKKQEDLEEKKNNRKKIYQEQKLNRNHRTEYFKVKKSQIKLNREQEVAVLEDLGQKKQIELLKLSRLEMIMLQRAQNSERGYKQKVYKLKNRSQRVQSSCSDRNHNTLMIRLKK